MNCKRLKSSELCLLSSLSKRVEGPFSIYFYAAKRLCNQSCRPLLTIKNNAGLRDFHKLYSSFLLSVSQSLLQHTDMHFEKYGTIYSKDNKAGYYLGCGYFEIGRYLLCDCAICLISVFGLPITRDGQFQFLRSIQMSLLPATKKRFKILCRLSHRQKRFAISLQVGKPVVNERLHSFVVVGSCTGYLVGGNLSPTNHSLTQTDCNHFQTDQQRFANI